jgi:sigma-E factor negative regulatory protein RseB
VSTSRKHRVAQLWRAVVVIALVAPAAALADDAREWLESMNRALAEKSYEGTFFHERGGESESLRIHHRVRGGEVAERLVSLDGSGREFIRLGDELSYILPDQRTILIERRPRAGGLLPSFPRFDDRTARFYRLEPVQRARFNDRDARLVTLMPLDPYRYGFRVWIDARTRLPLKSELYDRRGQVLERIAFASLQVSRDIPDSTFTPAVSTEGFRRIESDRGVRLRTVSDNASIWNLRTAPRGFRVTQRARFGLGIHRCATTAEVSQRNRHRAADRRLHGVLDVHPWPSCRGGGRGAGADREAHRFRAESRGAG